MFLRDRSTAVVVVVAPTPCAGYPLVSSAEEEEAVVVSCKDLPLSLHLHRCEKVPEAAISLLGSSSLVDPLDVLSL